MDFERAHEIGARGERLVSDELHRLAPDYGLKVLDSLLLKVRQMTAQLDHVVIDRYGVLIIESKVRGGATIKGSNVQKKWTACYPHGGNKPFQNPLMQNIEHENAMRQALNEAGNHLNPDYVKSAVVFAGANLSRLELDSLARAKVVDVADVEALIRDRHAFALNAGDLTAEDIARLAGLLQGLDRSSDQGVISQHEAYRQGAGESLVRERLAPKFAHGAGNAVGRAADRAARRVASALVSLFVRLLVVGAMLFALYWFSAGPGQPVFLKLLGLGKTPVSETAAPVGPTLDQAKSILLETAPDKYPNVVNLDQPLQTQVAQGTTFTWEYVSNPAANIAEVKTIALTLDASGNLVGVDIR